MTLIPAELAHARTLATPFASAGSATICGRILSIESSSVAGRRLADPTMSPSSFQGIVVILVMTVRRIGPFRIFPGDEVDKHPEVLRTIEGGGKPWWGSLIGLDRMHSALTA